jgi:hypothetical protein
MSLWRGISVRFFFGPVDFSIWALNFAPCGYKNVTGHYHISAFVVNEKRQRYFPMPASPHAKEAGLPQITIFGYRNDPTAIMTPVTAVSISRSNPTP